MVRLRQALFQPVDGAGLVWFRVLFGAIMVWEMARYLSYGWVKLHYVDPPFHFTYLGLHWVAPLPGDGSYVHAVVLGVLAACIALGLFYRVAAPLFFVGFSWFFLIEQSKYLNHQYLVCLLSLICVSLPADRMLSVDAWRKPAIRCHHVPAWSIWLLRFQFGVVYFYGGIAKLNSDWLSAQPMTLWLAERWDYPVVGGLYAHPWAPWFFSYAGVAFDLLIPFLLLWRRTRWLALAAVAVFHVSNEIMFSIGIFPYLMLAATLLFLEPSWPRRAFPLLFPRGAADLSERADRTPSRQGGVMALLALWALVQLLLPLRHHLYPGNPSWTEEGHLFAWHMKLRDKSGRVRFTVEDKETGERWTVPPAPLLTDRQLRKMKTRPDLAHQFAIYLAERARADGHADVAVYADLRCSLNGRPYQQLIDPTVDLASRPRTLWHKDWLVPLSEPLPSSRALPSSRPRGGGAVPTPRGAD